MKMLKVTFALLLLLLSSTVFAFSPNEISLTDTDQSVGHQEVSETNAYVYDSTLSFSVTLQKKAFTEDAVMHSFRFSGAYESATDNNYLKRSRHIAPGLDVPEIIFPFHVFL